MRQIWTSRKVWLPILLLFTAVLIFACRDRGVAIDFDGTGLYHASPLDSAIETVPVSFHGQLRKNVYTVHEGVKGGEDAVSLNSSRMTRCAPV